MNDVYSKHLGAVLRVCRAREIERKRVRKRERDKKRRKERDREVYKMMSTVSTPCHEPADGENGC